MINSQTKAVDEQLDKILDKLVSYYVGNRESLSPDEAKQSLLQLITEEKIKELENLNDKYGTFVDTTMGVKTVTKAVSLADIADRIKELKGGLNK